MVLTCAPSLQSHLLSLGKVGSESRPLVTLQPQPLPVVTAVCPWVFGDGRRSRICVP